jgi:hypothetical protein
LRQTLVVIIFLVVGLTPCTKSKEYHHVFTGESNHWIGELVQDGDITFKDHKELEAQYQYEIDYNRRGKLTITFKGEKEELGDRVEFSSVKLRSNTSYGPAGINGEWTTTEFTSSSSGGGNSHIPKDMEFVPLNLSALKYPGS